MNFLVNINIKVRCTEQTEEEREGLRVTAGREGKRG